MTWTPGNWHVPGRPAWILCGVSQSLESSEAPNLNNLTPSYTVNQTLDPILRRKPHIPTQRNTNFDDSKLLKCTGVRLGQPETLRSFESPDLAAPATAHLNLAHAKTCSLSSNYASQTVQMPSYTLPRRELVARLCDGINLKPRKASCLQAIEPRTDVSLSSPRTLSAVRGCVLCCAGTAGVKVALTALRRPDL